MICIFFRKPVHEKSGYHDFFSASYPPYLRNMVAFPLLSPTLPLSFSPNITYPALPHTPTALMHRSSSSPRKIIDTEFLLHSRNVVTRIPLKIHQSLKQVYI
jgi:hypothetical protein